MSFWHQAPLFRLIIPFLAGVILAIYQPHEIPHSIGYLGASLCLLLGVISWKRLAASYRWRWFFGVLTHLILFGIGYQLAVAKTELLDTEHFSKVYAEGDWAKVKITEPIVAKARSNKVVVEVQHVYDSIGWWPTSGHAILYLKKDSLSSGLHYGDVLLVKPDFDDISPPQNPNEFNYKRYLYFHNIYQQSYVPSGMWMRLGENKGFFILRWAGELRKQLLGIFKENGMANEEFAVASALILGYKDELDKDLVRSYSGAGATHVLAVSGLHVGIIYIVLAQLLRFLQRWKWGRVVEALLMISFLWFYATLTGLSPSVLRASTMFSFIIVAKAAKRNTNIYNTLAASAFFLLLWNPFLIMEVGFQLSYLAVIGIVFVQPKLYHLIEVPNWLLDKVWAITTVSIGAQIATFPLGLLYFHQFPVYFLFSNLIVIPMASVIIYLGITVFVFSFWPMACAGLGWLLEQMVAFLNLAVKFIETAPYSLLQGISISVPETYAIYAVVGLTLSYFTRMSTRHLHWAMLIVIGLLVYNGFEAYQQSNQNIFIVYNTGNTPAYDLIDGRQHWFIADSALRVDPDRMLFHIKHNWWELALDQPKDLTFTENHDNRILKEGDFIKFRDKRIVTVTTLEGQAAVPIQVDYLVLTGKPKFSMEELQDYIEFKQLIIDSSVSEWYSNKWLKEAAGKNIPCHAVTLQGAFVAHL